MPARAALTIDPSFRFAWQATADLSRKQQLWALYYVRLLQTGQARKLRAAMPAHLYRGMRHFLSDADWPARPVVWRAAAEVLRAGFDVEWLALRSASIPGGWTWLYLAAYDERRGLPLDFALVGPAGQNRPVEQYLPFQRAIFEAVPDELFRRAPLAVWGPVAEEAAERARLAARGLAYSAKVRPGSARLGHVVLGRRAVSFDRVAALLKPGAEAHHDLTWRIEALPVRSPEGLTQTEAVFFLWQDHRLVSVALTNVEEAGHLRRMYDPSQLRPLARPRAELGWQRTRLRGAQAWEHHLALNAVWIAHEPGRSAHTRTLGRAAGSPACGDP